MVQVVFSNRCYSENVNDNDEGNFLCLMSSEGRGSWRWDVSVLGKVGDKAVLGKAAGLFEARHAFLNIHVDIPVVHKFIQVVGVNDFLGGFFVQYFHILVSGH